MWGKSAGWLVHVAAPAVCRTQGGVQQQETKAPPCEDIKIVDRLWSKASNGNLGFTAQRQVMKPFGNNWEQAYKQLRWLSPDQEWKIKYLYNGERYNFKIGYSPDFKEPITKGYLPTFERGYNFAYSLDGTLYMCNINWFWDFCSNACLQNGVNIA